MMHTPTHNIMGIAPGRWLASFGITIVLSLSVFASALAQSHAQIKNVDFELVNNEVIITYDIVKHQPGELFKVWIKVYTAQENELKSASATGSVGENVAGGNRKKIIWSPKKDGIFLNNDIYIQVFATSTSNGGGGPEVSMGKWLAISALYPGAGNAKMRSNKLWLAAGGVGYGCMIGSILVNNQAARSYDNYLLSQDITERNNFYNKAESQKQLSSIFFVLGVVVWTADLIVFSVSAKDSGGSARRLNNIPVSLGYSNEPIEGHLTQRLALKLSF